ncbi:MAG: tetratricopeptide repeat protein [Gammaproteobacteria bacterium]|nr:tetratricopeptide repeat protein [Gammaproteobacteria bacterium]
MSKINPNFTFSFSDLVTTITAAVKPVRFLVLLAPLVLTGCNTFSASNDSSAADSEITREAADEAASKNISDDSSTQQGELKNNTDPSSVAFEDSGFEEAETDDEDVKPVILDGDSLFNLLAAEFAGNVGDVDASLKYYRQAAQTIEDSRIAARTAYIALYGEEYAEALKALDRWRELDPDDADLSRMYAITHLKLGQPEKSVPYIEDILSAAHGSDADEALAVKALLAKEASTEDAYVVLQKLNETGEKNKHLLVLQSRYAAQLKNYDESLAILDQVLKIDPELHEVLIIKARILAAQGKHAEAAVLIKQVLSVLPDNNALRLQYARMLVEQRDLKAAIEQYLILHEKMPSDSEITLSLALLYIETKNLDSAISMLERLVETDDKASIANYYLGRIAQNQGDDKKAVSYYLRVRSGEYAFDAQLRIGILLATLGKTDEGLAKLDALAESQNNWTLRVKAYLAQGEILRKQFRYKEGVEMYTRALQQNKDDTTLLYARGLMAEKVDRLDMAEADLLKVISKEPDNADALNALGYTLADRTSRYKEALKYINRAAELVPDDPAILDSLGWVSYRLGKMDDAIKWLSKAFEKLEDAEIAAHYGEVLWQTNQKDKAREIWNKGKAQNAKNPVLIETLDRIKP